MKEKPRCQLKGLTFLRRRRMECRVGVVHYLSWGFIVCALAYLLKQTRGHTPYGRYVDAPGRPPGVTFPAKLAWVIQEAPCVLVPALLLLTTDTQPGLGRHILLWTFCLHYVQRTFVYGLLTRGRPTPLHIVVSSIVFCSVNAFLQSHYLLHCVHYQHSWMTYTRLTAGAVVFVVGMAINIHSDHILRRLRKPGEIVYRIPQGGMFEYVSGANFFGEMVEWVGYAIATWSLPTFSFALFTICSIGPRAYHHHRDYHHKFEDYPKSRKAVVPFLL